MCQPYGRTPPPRTMWPTYFIYAAQKEQIGYVLHKVGEDETMQRNKGCRTTKGATGSRNAGGKMAEDIGIDVKNRKPGPISGPPLASPTGTRYLKAEETR